MNFGECNLSSCFAPTYKYSQAPFVFTAALEEIIKIDHNMVGHRPRKQAPNNGAIFVFMSRALTDERARAGKSTFQYTYAQLKIS